MTCTEYIENLLKTYQRVAILSEKNDCIAYRLRHKTLGQDLVVHRFPKVLTAYETLCGICSPHLPLIYDAIALEDGQIVLEEYIEGLTVAEVMETGRYRYRGARKVLLGVCAALEVLHGQGLVHRDIKPENVVIDKNGRVVLIDFNASRKVSKAKKDTVVMGTVGYASPEQLGVSQSDARTDIYALGVLLNVMLIGKHPSEELAKGRVGRIVRKCTNVNPADRYPSVQALAEIL